MPLWQRLYNTVWLAFFGFIVIPRFFGKYALVAHVLIGVGMLLLARANAAALADKPVPDRVKRISKGVVMTSSMQLVLGLVLGGVSHAQGAPGWLVGVLVGLHVVVATAILAQSASLATGYDMWEEKEIGGAA